jgi:hypothetical protein
MIEAGSNCSLFWATFIEFTRMDGDKEFSQDGQYQGCDSNLGIHEYKPTALRLYSGVTLSYLRETLWVP